MRTIKIHTQIIDADEAIGPVDLAYDMELAAYEAFCKFDSMEGRALASEERLSAALEIIAELEWSGREHQSRIIEGKQPETRLAHICPICHRADDQGHAPDCKLAAILKEFKTKE